jgi:hypothetical protein
MKVSEIVLVFIVFISFGSLSIRSIITSYALSEIENEQTIDEHFFIEASVMGAVENPGFYKLKKGSTLNDLLDVAKIKYNAVVKKKDLQKILKDN